MKRTVLLPLLLGIFAAGLAAHNECQAFQQPTNSMMKNNHRRGLQQQRHNASSLVSSKKAPFRPITSSQTSLEATTTPLLAMSASSTSILGVISKMLSLVTAPVLFVLRTFKKDMGALTPRQGAWWAATLAAAYALGRLPPFWIRYTAVTDIPRRLYGKTMWGRAVSVSDGDTIRFLHQPTPWHAASLKKGQKKSEFALPVRICTIDTPETPKFGKPGQPFGKDAKQALTDLLEGKRIGMRLLQTDQYGRAVAQVFAPTTPFGVGKTMVDEYMLGLGLAEVYTGGGAVYGPLGLDKYLELQTAAQEAKLGIWSQGKKRESAAEYKRRTKSE